MRFSLFIFKNYFEGFFKKINPKVMYFAQLKRSFTSSGGTLQSIYGAKTVYQILTFERMRSKSFKTSLKIFRNYFKIFIVRNCLSHSN